MLTIFVVLTELIILFFIQSQLYSPKVTIANNDRQYGGSIVCTNNSKKAYWLSSATLREKMYDV